MPGAYIICNAELEKPLLMQDDVQTQLNIEELLYLYGTLKIPVRRSRLGPLGVPAPYKDGSEIIQEWFKMRDEVEFKQLLAKSPAIFHQRSRADLKTLRITNEFVKKQPSPSPSPILPSTPLSAASRNVNPFFK